MTKIKELRKQLKLSQSEIAHMFGICQQSYSSKERGKVPFNEREMMAFKLLVNAKVDPKATIDDIFYSE